MYSDHLLRLTILLIQLNSKSYSSKLIATFIYKLLKIIKNY